MGRFTKVSKRTEMSWSPLCNSPLRSAGPPAKMNDTNIPSPSSPPTMLNPRPVGPFCSTIFRTLLQTQITAQLAT